MITPTSFKAKFSNFVNVQNNIIQDLITEALLLVNPKCPKYELMLYYLVAHLLSLRTPTSQGGAGGNLNNPNYPASSQSVGDVSVTYALANTTGKVSQNFFNTTGYGQMYLLLAKDCGIGIIIA